MKFLEKFLDGQKSRFEKGGSLEKLYPLYEAADTFLFTPASVTRGNTHVRDSLDLKRTMILVVAALMPAVLVGVYNVGFQAHQVMAATGSVPAEGWRIAVMAALGLAHDPTSLLSNFVYGLLFFIPIWLVTNVVGGLIEGVFSMVRKHEINEGFLVTGWLFPLTLPPTIPLWQVAVGIAFGVIFAKEVFGGTGKNIFNPALMARAFLFFAYPAQISGDAVWTAVDGYTGATLLSELATGGVAAASYSWNQAFWGMIPGSIGETSTAAIIIGAILLLVTRIASWRIILGTLIGMVLTGVLFNALASSSTPFMGVPVHWHLVAGSFAFATVFMATDPVSASMTETGRWVYGFLIGVTGMIIRVLNPAYPEGWMLAILFMNAISPTIDYFVVRANIRRRAARHVG